ncbi:MAG: RNA-binding protein [Minwuia sp.]|uniref:RNA-binding protein n=1 Tax=Minwuia sp. TaxID=2493630 RepID=UPI003A8743A0
MVKRADRDAPERRCIVTGASGDTAAMIRFVLDPDGVVTPDLEERLPGRGAWLLADRDVMSKAVAKNPFPRAFRTAARLPDQLPDLLTGLLRRRCLDQLGLANGAGQLTAGYEKVREASERGPVGVMIVAADGGDTARSRAVKMAWDAPVVSLFDREDLSLALGRENVVHAAVAPGRLAEKFVRDAERLRRAEGAPDNGVTKKRIVDD